MVMTLYLMAVFGQQKQKSGIDFELSISQCDDGYYIGVDLTGIETLEDMVAYKNMLNDAIPNKDYEIHKFIWSY